MYENKTFLSGCYIGTKFGRHYFFPPVSSVIFSLRDSLLQKQIRSANLGYRGDLTQLAKGVSSKCNCEQSFTFLLRPIDRDNAPAQISPPFCH